MSTAMRLSPEPTTDDTLPDDAPMTMAREFAKLDGRPLAHWRGTMYAHERHVYRKIVAEQMRSAIYEWSERQMVMRGKDAAPYRPNTQKINSIIDALSAIAQVCIEQMPAWLDNHRPRAADIIAFPNGLLDVNKFVAGDTMLMPPTSAWFSVNVLPFSFDGQARCPQWLAFLADALSGDAELIAMLQEFFGYLLTDDTAQQKALLLSGPPRSGKGTIIRQIVRTIGDANCASLRLGALAERFGLESLMGKTVVVCPDAHLGRNSDSVGVLEKLKSIIGEDPQCIDLKFREPLPNVRLPARFVLAVNSLPDLPDSSVAMRSRLLMVPMRNSYEGREDRTLDDRLAKETAGVLVWALEGLKRLRHQGRFTEPRASCEILAEFSRLSSPVLAFIEDRCKLDTAMYVDCGAAWQHWQRYAKDAGIGAGSRTAFGLNLKSAAPSVGRARKSKEDGSRFWAYTGIGLQPPECGENDDSA